MRTGTSLPSRVSIDAQPPIFIDSSEVKQYVTALCLAINMTLPNDYVADGNMYSEIGRIAQGAVFCARRLT